MKPSKVLKPIALSLYLLIQSAIYILFLMDDFLGISVLDNTTIKFVSIILMLLFLSLSMAIDSIKEKRISSDGVFAIIAALFTVLSDLFLLVINDFYEIGVTCFMVVQAMYFLRISLVKPLGKRNLLISLSYRIILWIIMIFVLININMFSYLTVVTSLYFINLVSNFLEASISTVKYKNDRRSFYSLLILSIGLLLFIGCDVFVGIYNLTGGWYAFSWFFYLPSQVLITLSANKLYGFSLGGNNGGIQA